MARVLLALVVILVIATVYAVVDASLMHRDRVRGLPKVAWIAVIIIVPVIGIVLWFVVGRGPAVAPQRPARPDDAAPAMSDAERAEQDERIRQLEEELAALDAEDEAERERRASAPGEGQSPGGVAEADPGRDAPDQGARGEDAGSEDAQDDGSRDERRGDGPAAPNA